MRVSDLADLPEPVVMMGDNVVLPPYFLENGFSPNNASLPCVLLSALGPAEWDWATTLMKLTFPFCGKRYQIVFGVADWNPQFRFSVLRWEQDGILSFLIRTGDDQFSDVSHWSVEWGGHEYQLEPKPQNLAPSEVVPCLVRLCGTQIRLTVPAEKARQYGTLIIHYKWEKSEQIYPLQIPPLLASLES